MATPYINIYKYNETTQSYDTPVSTDNSFTEPIELTLDAEHNETKVIPLSIRTESGYIAPNVTIEINSSGVSRFTLSKDNVTFSTSISFENVDTTDHLFYAKAVSSDTDQPQTDRSTKFRFSGKLRLAS